MNTLSTITIMPSTKQELESFVEKAKNEILNGEQNPLLILRQLKGMELIIKSLLSDNDIKDCFLNEANKYPEKTINDFNCSIQKKQAPPKFDFSVCNDSEYNRLENEFNLKKTELDARKKFLKSIKDCFENKETGEVIYPPSKEQSEILSVTLK